MKSLAHPGWPYVGTPWEWRGFAKAMKDAKEVHAEYKAQEQRRHDYWEGPNWTVYQKQNFGPELK
jgi:hypothetical protein